MGFSPKSSWRKNTEEKFIFQSIQKLALHSAEVCEPGSNTQVTLGDHQRMKEPR